MLQSSVPIQIVSHIFLVGFSPQISAQFGKKTGEDRTMYTVEPCLTDKAAIYDIVDTSSGPKCIYMCLCTIKLPEIRKHKGDKTVQNSLDTADFCMLRLSPIADSFNIWTLQ